MMKEGIDENHPWVTDDDTALHADTLRQDEVLIRPRLLVEISQTITITL